jgi:hypothetical protein
MQIIISSLGQIIGPLSQLIVASLGRDRRSVVLERRKKVIALARDMKAAGLTPKKLRDLERRLTADE